jgi:hypothetical protein
MRSDKTITERMASLVRRRGAAMTAVNFSNSFGVGSVILRSCATAFRATPKKMTSSYYREQSGSFQRVRPPTGPCCIGRTPKACSPVSSIVSLSRTTIGRCAAAMGSGVCMGIRACVGRIQPLFATPTTRGECSRSEDSASTRRSRLSQTYIDTIFKNR